MLLTIYLSFKFKETSMSDTGGSQVIDTLLALCIEAEIHCTYARESCERDEDTLATTGGPDQAEAEQTVSTGGAALRSPSHHHSKYK